MRTIVIHNFYHINFRAKMEKRAKIDSATNGSSSAYKNNSYTQQNYNTGTNNVNNTGNANDQSQNYYNQWPQQQNYQVKYIAILVTLFASPPPP